MKKLNMQRNLCLILTAVLVLQQASFVRAETFKILGPRATGMAGAFVAVAEDANASYWNPAAIAQQQYFDSEVYAGVRAEVTGGLLKDINDVSDLAEKYKSIQTAQKNGSSISVDEFSSILTTLNVLDNLNQPGKGVLVDVNAGWGLRIMRVGFSINNFTSLGVSPFIDTVNLGLGKVSTQGTGAPSALGGMHSAISSGLDGVSFDGVVNTSLSDTTLQSARDSVVNAINTLGFDNIAKIVGKTNLDQNGITDATRLANALVNVAKSQNLTTDQINTAAQQMETTAPEVKAIVAAAAAAVDSGSGYSNNTSNVTLRGISLLEAGFSYGHRFFVDDLYLGGSLKILHGTVGYYSKQFLADDVSFNDIQSDIKNGTKSSIQPGIDLGLLYDKRESYHFRAGLLARNINNPSFDQPNNGSSAGEGKYSVNPQVRAGLAIYPFKRRFWVISTDIDVTKNNTPLPGFYSRMWALGTEINVVNSNNFNVALRTGITSNLAESDSKLAYAAGVGLKLFHFFMDISGSVSSKQETIRDGSGKDQKVPQNAQVAVSFGLNF